VLCDEQRRQDRALAHFRSSRLELGPQIEVRKRQSISNIDGADQERDRVRRREKIELAGIVAPKLSGEIDSCLKLSKEKSVKLLDK
jgi:hypothetical protein